MAAARDWAAGYCAKDMMLDRGTPAVDDSSYQIREKRAAMESCASHLADLRNSGGAWRRMRIIDSAGDVAVLVPLR
jgi:hypothetical protein